MLERELATSVRQTLAYFDLFSMPLTVEECFRFLWQPPAVGFEAFRNFLVQQTERGDTQLCEEQSGYYFLPGRAELVESRRRSTVPSERLFAVGRRAARLIAWVPFLRAIFVCNSVGAETATSQSDIDFLIIASPRRLWLVRFFCNVILRLAGLRTYGAKTAGRVCLSFFLDSENLDLSAWRVASDDVHFAYWLLQMLPLYDPEVNYGRFLTANQWARAFTPYAGGHHRVPPIAARSTEPGILGRIVKKIGEAFWRGAYGTMLENQFKQAQLLKIPFSVREAARRGDWGVVIASGILKLHERDTRREVRRQWLKKVKSLCVT